MDQVQPSFYRNVSPICHLGNGLYFFNLHSNNGSLLRYLFLRYDRSTFSDFTVEMDHILVENGQKINVCVDALWLNPYPFTIKHTPPAEMQGMQLVPLIVPNIQHLSSNPNTCQ